jgi:hypothetical protein
MPKGWLEEWLSPSDELADAAVEPDVFSGAPRYRVCLSPPFLNPYLSPAHLFVHLHCCRIAQQRQS